MNEIRLKTGKLIKLNQAFNMDCLDFMQQLPDKSVGLIMADPPYFEVKGEFDFIWKSFEDYLKDVEKWVIECKRILTDTGSLFWFGYAKKISYSQIIIDKYLRLENSLVWHKFDAQTNKCSPETMRSFKPVTERCLFYSNELSITGNERIKLDTNNFVPLRKYFEKVQNFICCGKNEIIKKIGQAADHPFRFNSSQWELPTETTYLKLIEIFKISSMEGFKKYEDIRKEYEQLRRKYEQLRRPFSLEVHNLTDVIKASQEGHISGLYDHDTIKPLGLIKKLLQTTTRKDTIVYIPFWGSGTDSVACYELGLNWLATETSKKHYENSNLRYEQETKQLLMEF